MYVKSSCYRYTPLHLDPTVSMLCPYNLFLQNEEASVSSFSSTWRGRGSP